MADLWSQIDDTLQVQALAVLGSYGDDLAVRLVLVDTIYNLDRLEENYDLPLVLITGVDATEEPGPHGDGLQHLDMTYSYRLVAVARADDKRAAQWAAKELRGRMLAFLRNLEVQIVLFGLVGDDGERVQQISYSRSGAPIYGKANEDEGPYLAVAAVQFTIATEI